MSDVKLPGTNGLGLRVGDWIEVRSRDEILSTLDEQGCLDSLPFMPEMLQHCGKRFRVYKSAHKTCDTIQEYKIRSMTNAVHLEGLRCNGESHGGCQAGCLLFWKEAWLKPVNGAEPKKHAAATPSITHCETGDAVSLCDFETLIRAARVPSADAAAEQERYRCQATELRRATTPLQWWDPRQYVKDIASRNVRLRDFVRYVPIATFNVVMGLHSSLNSHPYFNGFLTKALARAKRAPILNGNQTADRYSCQAPVLFQATTPFYVKDLSSRNVPLRDSIRSVIIAGLTAVKRLNSRLRPYPYISGHAGKQTPAEALNLQAGELVQVRSKDEIMGTLNAQRRNRGLSFDVEMLPYCGKTFRVLRRVERIVDEKTGKMIRIPNPCLVLEGVTCSGCVSTNRLFCPRSIYPYWHEIWLKRVDVTKAESGTCAGQLR